MENTIAVTMGTKSTSARYGRRSRMTGRQRRMSSGVFAKRIFCLLKN